MPGDRRKPDYNLWAAGDSGKGRAGAAWINDDGSISITLDPYSVLRGKGHAGSPSTIMLYPNDGKQRGRAAEPEKPSRSVEDLEDDIPF